MQIVIDIPEKDYKNLRRKDKFNDMCLNYYEKLIVQGTPLTKVHGRLIDADKLKTHFVGTELGTDLEVYLEPTIINAPTVIEEYCEE